MAENETIRSPNSWMTNLGASAVAIGGLLKSVSWALGRYQPAAEAVGELLLEVGGGTAVAGIGRKLNRVRDALSK